jgi:hypothetical protein
MNRRACALMSGAGRCLLGWRSLAAPAVSFELITETEAQTCASATHWQSHFIAANKNDSLES